MIPFSYNPPVFNDHRSYHRIRRCPSHPLFCQLKRPPHICSVIHFFRASLPGHFTKRKSPENLFRANITSLYLHQRPWKNKKLWNCYIPEQHSCTTSHRVSCIFFHPDFNCRPRNFTGSCLLRLAGFTAGRETIPALKTFYSFLVHSIQNLSTVVNPKRKSLCFICQF